jgi:hypothetical protein
LLLVVNLLVVAAALAVAIGGSSGLAIGSLAPSGAEVEPDFIVATTGDTSVRSGVYRVALRVISSQVDSDPAVTSLRRGPVSGDGHSTSLLISLSGGDGDRQRAVERIEPRIDPGPLRVDYGGSVAAGLDARHDLAGDLWRLVLLVMPFVALLLAVALGPRLAAAPVICATTAIAGALAGLVIVGLFADVSLLGMAPAAVVGLVLGVEGPCALFARYRAETARAPRREALRLATAAAADTGASVGVAATVATAGLLATSLDQAPSMVLGCGLAAALALASSLVCGPALISLATDDEQLAPRGAPGRSRLAQGPARLLGRIAGSRQWTAITLAVAVVLMVAAALPIADGQSRPFTALDLPSDAAARMAATIAGIGPAAGGGSLFGDLALAAGVSAVALLVVIWITFRSVRLLPVAVVALLPAAAACGLCVLVFQEGHLAGAINQQAQGALETGAVASLLAALASVAAARAVGAVRAVTDEPSRRLAPADKAQAVAGLTLPAAIVATLIAVTATGVLGGADLYAAREFGLTVAAGLLIELVLLRGPLIVALARWAR